MLIELVRHLAVGEVAQWPMQGVWWRTPWVLEQAHLGQRPVRRCYLVARAG